MLKVNIGFEKEFHRRKHMEITVFEAYSNDKMHWRI
jgi:hypothetical protein